jgi:phosphatidylglycerophosphate synthase
MGKQQQDKMPPAVCAILVGSTEQAAFSLRQDERWRRALSRAGVTDVRRDADARPEDGNVILARGDLVLEEVLVKALIGAPDTVLVVERGVVRRPVAAHVPADMVEAVGGAIADGSDAGLPAGLRVADPLSLGSGYNHALRKRAVPYALILGEMPLTALEWRMFKGAYKGVTDFVTKWLWPWPACWATRWCAAAGITPNAVTAASFVTVLLALWLFAAGHFGWGLLAAWSMTFLDTVDGKLARVTLTSSKWGNVFDHGIDLIHPPFWYVAWCCGVAASGFAATDQVLSLWIVVIGYIAGRLQEGLFIWRFGLEMHAWQAIDSQFRLFTARRNPNLALMTAAVAIGRPDLALIWVAVWTVACFAFHCIRIGQAFAMRARGQPVQSWLIDKAAAARA